MTKEELKEMIDSTINENGSRNITGKSLNLALNEIVDAMGSGSGGGTLSVYFAMGNETEEQKAHNAATYAACKAMVEAGNTLPSIMIDMSAMLGAGVGGSISMASQSFAVGFDESGAMGGQAGLMLVEYLMLQTTLIIAPDGSVTVSDIMSTMSLRR